MNHIIITTVILLLVNGCSKDPSIPVSLVKIESKDYGDTKCNIVIEEVERSGNTSKVKLTYDQLGSSVGSSMFIARGVYEIAKARGYKYFTNLKEWSDPNGERFYIAGFANVPDPNIHKEFGSEYSSTNEHGQKRIFMSVSQMDMLFNLKNIEHEDSNRPAGAVD